MPEEFDPEAVHRLVDTALQEDRGPGTSPPVVRRARMPLGFNDSPLLEELHTVLSARGLHTGDVQGVLDDLRGRLYQGIDRGNLREMHAVVRYCRRCPAMEPDPQQPLWNLHDPDVVFVSDSPPARTDADSYLIEALKTAGFNSSRICLTWATRCRVAENRPPSPSELQTCSGYLHNEIAMLQPKLICPLGNLAAGRFLGTVKITEDHGRFFWLGPWPVLPLYTPAYALRSGHEQDFAADLNKAFRFVYGEQP